MKSSFRSGLWSDYWEPMLDDSGRFFPLQRALQVSPCFDYVQPPSIRLIYIIDDDDDVNYVDASPQPYSPCLEQTEINWLMSCPQDFDNIIFICIKRTGMLLSGRPTLRTTSPFLDLTSVTSVSLLFGLQDYQMLLRNQVILLGKDELTLARSSLLLT